MEQVEFEIQEGEYVIEAVPAVTAHEDQVVAFWLDEDGPMEPFLLAKLNDASAAVRLAEQINALLRLDP